MKTIFRSTKGQMLVQVLISLGLMSILSLLMAMIFNQQNQQIARMHLKSDLIDYKNTIRSSLSKNGNCLYNFKTLNPNVLAGLNSGAVIPLNAGIKNGDDASSPVIIPAIGSKFANIAKIKDITLNISGATPDFIGELKISIQHGNFDLKPLVIPNIEITTDATKSNMLDCNLGGTAASSGQVNLNHGMKSWSNHGSYSFTVPDDVYHIKATVVGAGGKGSPTNNLQNVAGNGGGGGATVGLYLGVTPGDVLTMIVGKGGAGATNPPRKNGGDSKILKGITQLVIARGGQGALYGNLAGHQGAGATVDPYPNALVKAGTAGDLGSFDNNGFPIHGAAGSPNGGGDVVLTPWSVVDGKHGSIFIEW